jgi:hypothetical protein
MERASKKVYILLIYVALALATFIAFGQLCRSDFVNYDDDVYVTENRNVNRGITAKAVFWAFINPHCNMWHPLTSLSHMLDCQLFGLVPFWHHLTSLLLHIASTLLLFWVLKRMTGDASPLPAPLRLPAQAGTGAQVRSKAAGKHPALKFGTDAEQ